MKHIVFNLLIAVSAAILPASNTYSADDKDIKADQSRHCLPISHLKRIEIVDNQSLIFHMNNKIRYINKLPFKCSGLKSRGTFLHETSLASYCDLDTITVIDASLGMRLGSCPLGKFELYNEPKEKAE